MQNTDLNDVGGRIHIVEAYEVQWARQGIHWACCYGDDKQTGTAFLQWRSRKDRNRCLSQRSHVEVDAVSLALPFCNGDLAKTETDAYLKDLMWKWMLLACVIFYGSYTVLVHLCEALPFCNGDLAKTETDAYLKDLMWKWMLLACVIFYGSYTVLVHLCEVDGVLPFSSASVVLLTEATKLGVSLAMISPSLLQHGLYLPPFRVCLLFVVPAALYCTNNNIAIHMQLQMDPTTYQVLSNMKIGTTALLYRIIMKRHLTSVQWLSLLLLACAGISDSYGSYQSKEDNSGSNMYITLPGLLLVTLYCVISGLSGVYTEFILKKYYTTSLHIQNILLYTFGIAMNGATWLVQATHSTSGDSFNLTKGYSVYTWLIVFSQAGNGLIMSAVLKHASNITRLFIISCAMLVATGLSVLVLHITLNIFFLLAFALVVIAIGLYYR